jgi:DNA-binding MarR family transcriptional regulator
MCCEEEQIKHQCFETDANKATVNVMVTAGWLHGRFNAFLRSFDLSHEQYNVLRVLRRQHPKSVAQKDILEHMFNPCSNLTPIIAKLKEKQLVEVGRADNDRREYRISLTTTSMAILDQIDENRDTGSFPGINLNAEEVEQLCTLLEKMRNSP